MQRLLNYYVLTENGKGTINKINSYCITTESFYKAFPKLFTSGVYAIDYKANKDCLESFRKQIELNKLVVFPISNTDFMDKVKNYLELGFTVWFMKAKDYKQFKKDYALSM